MMLSLHVRVVFGSLFETQYIPITCSNGKGCRSQNISSSQTSMIFLKGPTDATNMTKAYPVTSMTILLESTTVQ